LDGKDKVGIVGAIEERHESLCMTFHFSNFATTYSCFNNKICEILKVAAN